MFNIGELVINRKTGDLGTVYNYGHQIVNSVYLPTLIVRISETTGQFQTQFVEDLASEWTQLNRQQEKQPVGSHL